MAPAGTLERYRVLRPLGAGGMGTVDLAEDAVLGRPVALKRVLTLGDDRARARLRREALTGAALSHPNLVAVFDVLEDEEGLVVVMEYIEGETLRAALMRRPLVPSRALEVIGGVAAGLDHAHGRGVIHRDVKPGNVLLGPVGTVKLADLGLAVSMESTRVTSAGQVVGTLSYMAPEQLDGNDLTPAADIYALAAVAFEALSGRKAQPQGTAMALAHALTSEPPPDLREAWPDAPPAAAAVLTRGMARDPLRRPRSAGELVARLREALRSAPTAPVSRPVPRPEVPRPVPVSPTAAPVAAAPVAHDASTRAPSAARRPAEAPAALPASRRPAARARSAPPVRSAGSRRPLALAGVLLAGALAVLAAVLLSGGGGGRGGAPGQGSSASSSTHAASSTRRPPAGRVGASSSSTVAPAPAPVSASAGNGSPAATVQSFYGLAAKHQYAAAWALADPAFRSQLGGFQAFSVQQSTLRSISFPQATVISSGPQGATVAIRTVAVHTDRIDHCVGTVRVVPHPPSGWVIDGISIRSC